MAGGNGKVHSPAGSGQTTASGNGKPSDNEIIDRVARHKGTTGDGFRAYGAIVKNGNVVFPTFQLSDGKLSGSATSTSTLTIQATRARTRSQAGRRVPSRLPAATAADKPRVRAPRRAKRGLSVRAGKMPRPTRRWGRNAIGLNGKHIKKDFLPGFVAALKSV